MTVYEPDSITFEGVNGQRYWFYKPFTFTNVAEIDERLSSFPVAVFLPFNRDPSCTPLVIGLQGMCAPYGWNAFIVPTLTQMGIAVALFDTPLAGERSLVRSFTAQVEKEVKPLLDRNVPFNSEFLLRTFQCVARDISLVQNFCRDRYGLTDNRLALFGVSMGVLQAAFAFTAYDLEERLLGTLGHGNLQRFAGSWGQSFLPDLAASWAGTLAETILERFQPDLAPLVSIMRLLITCYFRAAALG